jgi:hypothetical protein
VTRADVFAPPLPGIDFLYLGFPGALIVGGATIAAAIVVFRFLRRRKIHGCLSVAAAVLVFTVADCASYVIGLNESSARKRDRRERWEREAEEQAAAAASASASSPASASAMPGPSASAR